MSTEPASFEWSEEQIRKTGQTVVELIAKHVSRLPDSPVFTPFPAERIPRYLHSDPPADGQSIEEILELFAAEVEPFPFGNGHPRFFGWVNSPPALIGVFAEALAAAMNPSCAGGNHAAVYVERQVIDWFKQIVGLPATAMGLLVSGGSMAALTALTVARHYKAGPEIRSKGIYGTAGPLVVYKTGEGHGCHQKAVELLGIGSDNLRSVAYDSELRMLPAALDRAIRADLAGGRIPMAVIASAGTVNTGAIDPLAEIAAVCAEHKVWLHVDGAYGAPAILTSHYENSLAALGRADSLALDPHKWLYVPVEAGLVLIRDGELMRSAFSLVPPYLRTDGKLEGVGGPPWMSEYGFQQTRGFRALKVWMALRYFGLSGYRTLIERDIELAGKLASAVRALEGFEVWEPRSLSIVCLRYAPLQIRADDQRCNAINAAILEKIQLGGQAFLSSTVIEGRFWMRACFVNPRTHDQDIGIVAESLRVAAMALT